MGKRHMIFRTILLIFSLILISGGFVRGSTLLLCVQPEYREAAEKKTDAWRAIWQKRGMDLPQRCFPRHSAPRQTQSKSGFGQADLSLWYKMEIPETMQGSFLLHSLNRLPFFRHVEWKNEAVFPLAIPNDPAADSINGSQRQVLRKIRAYEAWALSEGDSNVIIGLLDTGTPVTHEDLAGNIRRNEADPVNGMDDDGNGLTDDYLGWDFGSNDNNPAPDNNGTAPGHGTSVSSLAGASTGNGTGIAGIGWKCRILPVKIWNWAGSFSNFSGYEAIVYAADMGCRVINCSWGGPGAGSQFEQDIIRYATFNKGALVVAAGGNTAGYYQFLPANYDYVLGVSMTDTSDRIVSAASRHFKLDLTAPGVGVFGIRTSGNYGWVDGGSSMACPQVAGAAALLLSRFPELNGLQAGELLRVNSDTIYHLPGNAGFRDQCGRGRLNIFKALKKENRISLRAVECRSSGRARPGDTLRLALRFENYLEAVPGFSVQLSVASVDFTMLNSEAGFGAMESMAELESGFVFSGIVNPALSTRKELAVKAEIRSGAYRDVRWFQVQLNPGWITLDSNEVEISVAENGRLGFADLAGYLGSGIRYKGIQVSGDAGLMLGTGPSRVSNCVFSGPSTDAHFKAENRPAFSSWPELSQHAFFHFNDSLAATAANGFGIKQSVYESTADSLRSALFISYQITNRNAVAIDSLCVGMYNDWESDDPDANLCRWDSSLQMGYTSGQGIRNNVVGTLILEAQEPQFFAIDALPDTAGGNINLYDGFSQSEKWKTLSSGLKRTSAGGSQGNNVLQVCGSKLRNLQPGETRKIAFAFVFGDSLPDLQQKAGSARNFFRNRNISPGLSPQFSSFCEGDTVFASQPSGVSRVRVYGDSLGNQLLFSGTGFQAQIFSDSLLFAGGADSLVQGNLIRWQWEKKPLPDAGFSCQNCINGDTMIVTGPSVLNLKANGTGNAAWFLNAQLLPQFSGQDSLEITVDPADSIVEICLEKTDEPSGCSSQSCRSIRLFIVNGKNQSFQREFVQVFFPSERMMRLHAEEAGEAILSDVTGKCYPFRFQHGQNDVSLKELPPGFYQLRCKNLSDTRFHNYRICLK